MEYDWNKIFESIYVTSAVIFSVVCVLGVLGNGVVIWATGFRMKKTVNTVWYLNLAVADFLATAFLPLKITCSVLDFHWPFGWFMCKIDAMVFFVNMYASIFTLVLISVDRCVCVVRPLWARCSGHRTVRRASCVSLGVWVLASALSSPHVVFTDTEPYRDDIWCLDGYASSVRGVATNFLAGFVVPFSVIVSCYSAIAYRVRNTRSLVGQSGRSFRIMATVIAVFFLCWIPFHVTRLIKVVYQPSGTLDLVLRFGFPISRALALLNSCLNPLLYVFSQRFTDVFRRSILWVLEKAFAEEPSQTSNTPTEPAATQRIRSGPPGTKSKDPRGELI